MKEKIASGEWQSWSAGKSLGPRSEETKLKQSQALKGKKRNDDQKLRISNANKKAWSEGKFTHRKSNNMREYIWVIKKEDNSRTRIKKTDFNNNLYILGR